MTSTINKQFGLIGYPLSHSFSKKYFNEKFEREGLRDHHYELFPLATIEEFPAVLKNTTQLKGLNVTIPYKEAVIPFLDELSPAAAAIGAVNTIRIVDGKTKGYNSDVFGFRKSLENYLESHQRPVPKTALILGTGGAAKAVDWVLTQMGIKWTKVSRKPAKHVLTYDQLDTQVSEESQLIVNTTPLGMSPRTALFPRIPYTLLGPQHLLFDLVYNPQKTVFLARAEKQKSGFMNGLEMLHLQADRAWEIWNEEP